jgi:reverse transcriptase-like protein
MSGSALLRWRDVYGEAELYKAAIRVYTKPLFHWRKALATSTDGRNLYDMAARGLRGLDALHRALAARSFAFRPVLALHYNFNGKHRTLHLAPWEDRIVDLLLYRVLNRRLHAWFSPHAYAYRDRTFGLDACQARIAGVVRDACGPLYVVKRDIADCFASMNHARLFEQLATLVAPSDYLGTLLDQRIRFTYADGDAVRQAQAGIPFGTAIACLLANVALTDLDREMETVQGLAYFRYADDLLLLARERRTALDAAERLEAAIAALHLRCKPSHTVELLMGSPIADARFTAAGSFRHLGLLFCSGGAVRLSRDKGRKLQNLFRFAFRRRERGWRRESDPRKRARALCVIAAETLGQGVRNVAIVDYYMKHTDDERQWRALDRWLAEEVLSRVFGGHKRGHFGRIGFAELRALGLPSLVHRRRLLRRGAIESAFFIWQMQRATRAFGRTVVRPAASRTPVFSSFPQAAASTRL